MAIFGGLVKLHLIKVEAIALADVLAFIIGGIDHLAHHLGASGGAHHRGFAKTQRGCLWNGLRDGGGGIRGGVDGDYLPLFVQDLLIARGFRFLVAGATAGQ